MVLTNGAMSVSASSSAAISLALEADRGNANCAMSDNDWYIYFTIGNLMKNSVYGNSKADFSIPDSTYTMITVQKGSDTDTAKNHKKKDDSSLGLVAHITEITYDESTKL